MTNDQFPNPSARRLPQPKKINHGDTEARRRKREEFGTTDAHRFIRIKQEMDGSSNDFVL
jgi:hypothetical protein